MDKKRNQGMEQIVNYILKNGRKENNSFFEKEQEKIDTETGKEFEKLEIENKQSLSKIKNDATEELQQELQKEDLAFKRKLMLEKQYYLELIEEELKKKLYDWSEKDFLTMVRPILIANKLQGVVQVKVGADSKDYLTQARLQEFATAHTKDITYKLINEAIPEDGGFVLSQSGIEYNYLFSSILDQVSEEMELKLAQLLFGNEVS